MANKGANTLYVILAVLVIGMLGLGYMSMKGGVAQSVAGTTVSTPGGNAVVPAGCTQNPSYSYSGVDKLVNTVITGTDEIKTNGFAPVTTLANPQAGTPLQYWKSNSTYFCSVKDAGTVQCGAQQVQADCYQSTTPTLKVYDQDNALFLTSGGGANNLTVGANEVHNLKLTYQGTAFKSAVPLGGCIAIEVPSSITQVTLPGYSACPYKWTYTVSSTSNTYFTFGLPSGFDANGLGDLKELPFQMKSGASNPSGTAIVTVIAGNNYIGNDGNFKFGIEKDFNADTTKTFSAGTAFNFTIA